MGGHSAARERRGFFRLRLPWAGFLSGLSLGRRGGDDWARQVDEAPSWPVIVSEPVPGFIDPQVDEMGRCFACRRPMWFVCPRCGLTEYDPDNVASGFCGSKCLDWTGRGVPVHPFGGRGL